MEVPLHDDLEGQVCLVTGATRGIGERIAAELTALGATVYAGARDLGDVDAPDQRAIQLDVRSDDEIEAALDRIEDEAGRLDVLVNNAGVIGPRGLLEDVDLEGIDTTLDTNLRGSIAVTRAALPLLIQAATPRVVKSPAVLEASGRA